MDEQAWAQTRRRLHAFVAARLSPADAVDDVVQDVLVKLVQHLDGLADDTRLQAWAYRIARNALTDEYRRRGRTAAALTRAASASATEVRPDVDPVAEEVLAADLVELSACLGPLVDALDEPYRDALVATGWEGLTQAQAAARAGVSLPGMKSRVQRGRAQLREQLQACCELEPGRDGLHGRPTSPGCGPGCGCSGAGGCGPAHPTP